jgi:hypothetical protein
MSRRLGRNPEVVNLDLASRDSQVQAVISRSLRQTLRREPEQSSWLGQARYRRPVGAEVCAGSQTQSNWFLQRREPQTQAVMSRPAVAEFMQEARSSQFGSDRQGTAGAGSHEQAGRGRYCGGSQTISSWV